MKSHIECGSVNNPAASLLTRDEPAAFTLLNAEGKSRVVLVCDHASCRVPLCLHDMGLSGNDLHSHIGWDSGAAWVAQALAKKLDAALVMSGYSRLVIDCNRPLNSPESIPTQVAGIAVPANLQLTPAERMLRVAALFNPYQQAIASLLEQRRQQPVMLLSIHSFTPELNGVQRPWQIGVAYFHEHWLAQSLYQQLQRSGELSVGFNQPYAIEAEFDYTIPVQGEARGLPSAMIEIRQDGITSKAEAERWAARIATAIGTIDENDRYTLAT